MSDLNNSDPAKLSGLPLATGASGLSTQATAGRPAPCPRASIAVPRRIGRNVSNNPGAGILMKSVRSLVRDAQSAEGIPVRLNLKYDPKRTSEWLRRVLAEARAHRSKTALCGVVQR
jgi:hypothetical protein